MLIIYRKSDGVVVDNQGTNSLYPLGIPEATILIDYIAKKNGGNIEDYEVLRLHDIDDIEIVNKTFTHEYSIQDGQIVFGEEIPIPEPEPQPPSEVEILQQENAMLQMSMMEMTMYAATQDERLQGQEQAILELSMIVAGGGS